MIKLSQIAEQIVYADCLWWKTILLVC